MVNNNNNVNVSEASELLAWLYYELMNLLKDKKFNKKFNQLLKNLQKEESVFNEIFLNMLRTVEAFDPDPSLAFSSWTVKTALNQLGIIRKKYDATIKYTTAEALYQGIYGSQSIPTAPLLKIFLEKADFDLIDFAYYLKLLASQYRAREFRDLVVELIDIIDEAVALYNYKSKNSQFKNMKVPFTGGDFFHQKTNQMRTRLASELQADIYDNSEKITKIVSELSELGICEEPAYSLGLTPDYDFLHERKLIEGGQRIGNLILENDRHLSILKRFAESCKNSANFIKNQKEHLKLTIENIDQRLADLEQAIDTSYQQLNEVIKKQCSFQQQQLKKNKFVI